MRENLDVFDFPLEPAELESVRGSTAARAPERDPEAHGH